MTTHELKTHTTLFQQSWNKTKTYEIRKDDGNKFKVGDTLILRETDKLNPDKYTGRSIRCRVTHKSSLFYDDNIINIHRIGDGWCVMSVKFIDFINRKKIFDDDNIIEANCAIIKNKKEQTVVGVVLLVRGIGGDVEVVLEEKELENALQLLNENRY